MPTGYEVNDTTINVKTGGAINVESGGEIDIESGGRFKLAGTQVTANATELSQLDGTTTLATDFVGDITFNIEDQVGNDRNVAVQLKDLQGTNLAFAEVVWWVLSDDSGGAGITGTAPSGGVAIGDDGTEYEEFTAGKSGWAQTSTTGAIDITLTETSTASWYLVVKAGQGASEVSGEIAFA
jgi:hypothetical protein